jgi:mono/diheme cytochrome c family protein
MSRLSARNFVFGLFLGATVAFGVKADVSANFKDHCAACHGADRLGGLGPALVPENLARLRKAGSRVGYPRRAGRRRRWLGFGDKLAADEIKALVDYAYSPIKPMPAWGEKPRSRRHASSVTRRAACRTSRNSVPIQ